jgi:hypothetical protein
MKVQVIIALKTQTDVTLTQIAKNFGKYIVSIVSTHITVKIKH